MSAEIQILPLPGIPEITPGMDLGAEIVRAMREADRHPQEGDILVVTQKVVSKAEGRVVRLDSMQPSPEAVRLAKLHGKDPRLVELILQESKRPVRIARGVFIMETKHGFICANAGIDESNTELGHAVLLPVDPDASAALITRHLQEAFHLHVPTIISDTFGRPWREGQTNVAIGVAGMKPFMDYRGGFDPYGRKLQVTLLAIADEIAGAAELVMGKTDGIPAALVRGVTYIPGKGSARDLLRSPEMDMFR